MYSRDSKKEGAGALFRKSLRSWEPPSFQCQGLDPWETLYAWGTERGLRVQVILSQASLNASPILILHADSLFTQTKETV